MPKKAQAAMEFLMTYGWAILVVLVAVGALSYFGVLSPDNFLPSRCTFQSGISCIDFNFVDGTGTDTINLAIKNNMGYGAYQVAIQPENDEIEGVLCLQTGGKSTLENGEKDTYSIDCIGDLPSGRVTADILFKYKKQDIDLQHSTKGNLLIKIP